jgi:hypothetical protein
MIPFRAAAVFVSISLTPAAAASQESAGKQEVRRFEAAACPFKADEKLSTQLRCGYLIVP